VVDIIISKKTTPSSGSGKPGVFGSIHVEVPSVPSWTVSNSKKICW